MDLKPLLIAGAFPAVMLGVGTFMMKLAMRRPAQIRSTIESATSVTMSVWRKFFPWAPVVPRPVSLRADWTSVREACR